MEGIPEEFFLSEDYALFTETIGDHTQEFYALPSACTDYDLTGQVIWPGSKILASYLIKNCSIISEKAVLELGSGPGLTGLICSYFTKRMILSDGNDVILRLLERNKIYAHSDVEVCKIE